jgi:hypothetical protein
MENVVPIEQLDAFISEIISKVNAGAWEARQKGIAANLPEAIQISAIVVRQWQPESLAATTERAGTETGKQGGKTQETQSGSQTESANNSEQSNSTAGVTDTHKQTATTETSYTT